MGLFTLPLWKLFWFSNAFFFTIVLVSIAGGDRSNNVSPSYMEHNSILSHTYDENDLYVIRAQTGDEFTRSEVLMNKIHNLQQTMVDSLSAIESMITPSNERLILLSTKVDEILTHLLPRCEGEACEHRIDENAQCSSTPPPPPSTSSTPSNSSVDTPTSSLTEELSDRQVITSLNPGECQFGLLTAEEIVSLSLTFPAKAIHIPEGLLIAAIVVVHPNGSVSTPLTPQAELHKDIPYVCKN